MNRKVVALTAFVALPLASFATFFLVDATASSNQPQAVVATASGCSQPGTACSTPAGENDGCNAAAAPQTTTSVTTNSALPVAKLLNGSCPYLAETSAAVSTANAAGCTGAGAQSGGCATNSSGPASGCGGAIVATSSPAIAAPTR